MTLEITPEPTPEEREVLLQAMAAADASPTVSAWWDAGTLEAVEESPSLSGESPSGVSPAA